MKWSTDNDHTNREEVKEVAEKVDKELTKCIIGEEQQSSEEKRQPEERTDSELNKRSNKEI